MITQRLLTFLLIASILLTACSNQGRIQPRGARAMLDETWVQQINTNPNHWIKHADPWFLTGRPNLTQRLSQTAPLYKAITTSTVRVPDFTSIVVAGNFQVQIVGGQQHNSVYIYGPNDAAQKISVGLFKDKLVLTETGKSPANTQNVIVRIGIRNLRSLENMGNSLVMGRTIVSDKLRVIASGGGSVLLDGNMNLKVVQQSGIGTITILGACSQKLNISAVGPGNINISGHVGIENIVHQGSGAIHIIGADSDMLCINAGGTGLTTVYGYVNLKQVTAVDSSRVYVYWAFSKHLDVTQKANSIVGVAGSSANLNVNLSGSSCFLGQYLRCGTVYVKTIGKSHADVSADQKIFATAENQSGILYYGSPTILSKFTSYQATIIPLGSYSTALPNPPFIPYRVKQP